VSFLSFLPTIISVLSTVMISLVAWGFRTTISEIRNATKKNTERIEKLEDNFNDLKSDLPLIYVLREDFVRSMNSVENKMGGIDNKLDRLLEKTAKGGKSDG